MALITKAPRGTQDKLPENIHKWHTVEKVAKDIAESFGFKEIRTPTFEHTNLFERSVGETTDVVEKEMYTFKDKKGRSITLKPEGTAGAARASIENGLIGGPLPLKLFYFTSCFRYEAPQSGRLREHRQFGIEMFGGTKPVADAEVISVGYSVLTRLGLEDIELQINSIGCKECRKNYLAKLKAFYSDKKEELCHSCINRIDRNPMRLLDCKIDSCKEIGKDAPLITEYLCDECKEHFEGVKTALEILDIKYTINPRLVRGLDYYTKTVFEFISRKIGSQGTVCAGGRYDGLIEELGGNPTAGLGFGMGIERLLLVLENQKAEFMPPKSCDIYIAALDSEAEKKTLLLIKELREYGFWAENDICGRGLKAQMKYADKIGAKFTMVLGSNEVESGIAAVKNMKTGEKIEININSSIVEKLTPILMGDFN